MRERSEKSQNVEQTKEEIVTGAKSGHCRGETEARQGKGGPGPVSSEHSDSSHISLLLWEISGGKNLLPKRGTFMELKTMFGLCHLKMGRTLDLANTCRGVKMPSRASDGDRSSLEPDTAANWLLDNVSPEWGGKKNLISIKTYHLK